MPAELTVMLALHCDCGQCLKYSWNRFSGVHEFFQGVNLERVMFEISRAGWKKEGLLWISPHCKAPAAK